MKSLIIVFTCLISLQTYSTEKCSDVIKELRDTREFVKDGIKDLRDMHNRGVESSKKGFSDIGEMGRDAIMDTLTKGKGYDHVKKVIMDMADRAVFQEKLIINAEKGNREMADAMLYFVDQIRQNIEKLDTCE